MTELPALAGSGLALHLEISSAFPEDSAGERVDRHGFRLIVAEVKAKEHPEAEQTEAATAMIPVHNHPSGDARPSPSDVETTLRLAEAGRVVGVPLLDHLIVTPSNAYSSMLDLEVPAAEK